MFGFGKRKVEPSRQTQSHTHEPSQRAKPGTPLISAVLMQGDSYPIEQLKAQLERSQILGQRPTGAQIAKGILTARLGDEFIAIAPMPAPYPWTDLEGPCATSWMWPPQTPATTLKSHRSHVLVTMMQGQSGPIERRLNHTQLTALAAQQPGVMGIYWPDATMVHFPKVFIEMAQKITSPKAPPLYLWVDFRIFKNRDGTFGMFTTGLAPLGFMEIEIPGISMNPRELRDWSINMAYYLIDQGPVLKDGDTIGVDATHQIRLRHCPSLFGKRGTVVRLET